MKSSDGICVSIKPYLKIFCLFWNSLNFSNSLSDCSVITLGRAEMAVLESYLLSSFPLWADWKPCSGPLAWSPVKTAFQTAIWQLLKMSHFVVKMHCQALEPYMLWHRHQLWSFTDLPSTPGHHPWHYLSPGVSMTLWTWRAWCIAVDTKSLSVVLIWFSIDSGASQVKSC